MGRSGFADPGCNEASGKGSCLKASFLAVACGPVQAEHTWLVMHHAACRSPCVDKPIKVQ